MVHSLQHTGILFMWHNDNEKGNQHEKPWFSNAIRDVLLKIEN